MNRNELISDIKKKKPFIIQDISCSDGNFEAVILKEGGKHTASGWGSLVGPEGPFTLMSLKAAMAKTGDDAEMPFKDQTFDHICIKTVIEAATKQGVKCDESFYMGYVGTVGENAEVLFGKTREIVAEQIREELEMICELETAVEDMKDEELADYAKQIGIKI